MKQINTDSNHLSVAHSQLPPRHGGRRIDGLDLARAVAIAIMIILNYRLCIVKDIEAPLGGAGWFFHFIEGKGAALFVILAGVGLSLLAKKANDTNDTNLKKNVQITLFKRAAFLFVVGIVWVPLWPADILHFYGFYISIGALCLFLSQRWLFSFAVISAIISIILQFLFDYSVGWDFQTLTYSDFWSAKGMIRHLFFNGFHPIFPWLAFMFIGLWLGRQPWSSRRFRIKAVFIGVGIMLGAWFVSKQVLQLTNTLEKDTIEFIEMLVEIGPMPPSIFYVLTGTGFSLLAISACIECDRLFKRYSISKLLFPLIVTGQHSLSIYISHILIGLFVIEQVGLLNSGNSLSAVVCASIFFGLSMIGASVWNISFSRGPLELIMRKLSNTTLNRNAD